MKAEVDCIACLFKQALNTIRVVSDDPNLHLQLMKKMASYVQDISLDQTPTTLSQPAYQAVSELTGVADPYKELKDKTNQIALSLVPKLKAKINDSKDPLDMALHVAVAGNIIDFGIGHDFNIEKDVLGVLEQPFAISAIDDFRKELVKGRKLLCLGDNSGEIVFDRLLMEYLKSSGMDITYSVKSGPIINDALIDDARQVGMTEVVKVIETGSNDIGVNWNNVSDEFRETFENADIVLSKGHGNFETCNTRSENVYFLLKTKCQMVANAIGVRLGDIVFKRL